MAYARKMRERQEAALERLAEDARDLGLDSLGVGGTLAIQLCSTPASGIRWSWRVR